MFCVNRSGPVVQSLLVDVQDMFDGGFSQRHLRILPGYVRNALSGHFEKVIPFTGWFCARRRGKDSSLNEEPEQRSVLRPGILAP